MQSGNPTWNGRGDAAGRYQSTYDNITTAAGCANSTDSLHCLRGISAQKFNSIINGTSVKLTSFGPNIDSDFIQKGIATQLPEGKFVHVPIISGGKSDF
jgi:acetylcholinesterase